MLEKLYRLIHDFLFNATVVSDMNLAEYLITNGVTIPVKCKDCKRNNMNGGDCNRIIIMYHRDPVLELNVAEYIKLEYCSNGERKDNDL